MIAAVIDDDKLLSKLQKQKKSLAKRIKKVKLHKQHYQEIRAAKKRDVVGRYYIEFADEQGETGAEALKKLMDTYLKLDEERELFDLLPLDK